MGKQQKRRKFSLNFPKTHVFFNGIFLNYLAIYTGAILKLYNYYIDSQILYVSSFLFKFKMIMYTFLLINWKDCLIINVINSCFYIMFFSLCSMFIAILADKSVDYYYSSSNRDKEKKIKKHNIKLKNKCKKKLL